MCQTIERNCVGDAMKWILQTIKWRRCLTLKQKVKVINKINSGVKSNMNSIHIYYEVKIYSISSCTKHSLL